MQAVYLICSSKQGCSSHQLQRTLRVQYKTAWFMSHRIREAMNSPGGILGSRSGMVEADETFIGRKPGSKIRRGHGHKEAVFSLVERAGHVRSFHVNDVTAGTLRWKLAENVSYSATLMTDEGGNTRRLVRTSQITRASITARKASSAFSSAAYMACISIAVRITYTVTPMHSTFATTIARSSRENPKRRKPRATESSRPFVFMVAAAGAAVSTQAVPAESL